AAAAAAAARAADAAAVYAAAYDAAAYVANWSAVEADCIWLETAASAEHAAQSMTALPLWLGERPAWFDSVWRKRKRELLFNGTNALPLLDWFERRIEGHETAFALPPATDETLQIRIAEQPDEFWKRDFAAINADIARAIDVLTPAEPEIPPQRPAEVQTVIRDGRLALAHDPPAPIAPDQDARRQAAWRAIRGALDDYVAAGPTNNHPRLDRLIDRLSAALGASFNTLNPIGLGIQAQYVQHYAERADQFLTPERASDLVGLNMTLGAFLPRFPEWQAYRDDQGTPADVPAEALPAAEAVVEALGREDFAEPELDAKLEELVADAQDEAAIRDPDEPKLQVYRRRLLRALGNVFATLGRPALDWVKGRGGALTKGIDQGLESVGKRATQGLFLVLAHQLSLLAGLYPDLAWLGPLLTFLRDNLPKG
ncbi:MAG: hypothetical protein K2X76_03820, partial [Sphingomonas sp.]|nr:hypothetical protein [Sphingomonas sp.]